MHLLVRRVRLGRTASNQTACTVTKNEFIIEFFNLTAWIARTIWKMHISLKQRKFKSALRIGDIDKNDWKIT